MIDNINRLTKTQTNIRDNVNFFIFYLIFCLENNQTCMTTRWRASQFQAVRASTRRTRWRRLPRFGRSRLARPLSSSLKRWFFQHHHDCNQYYHHRDQDRTERICILPLFITKMPCQKVVGYMQFRLTHNFIKIGKMQNSSLIAIFVVVLWLICWSSHVIESFDNQNWTLILLSICEDPFSP